MKANSVPLFCLLIVVAVVLGLPDAWAGMVESFEDVAIGQMPPAGWKKWEEAGGRGWSNSWAGRQPMPGWMSGTNSVPPDPDAGSRLAYVTYTHGGSKTNDLWLISPKMRGVVATSTVSFWYRSSFSNFADNIYLMISTNDGAYRKSDFTIQAAHVSFPRGYPAPAGPGKWDFPEWTNIIANVGAMVPAGTDIYLGFQEHHYNNWYDVRANEMDVIRCDMWGVPELYLYGAWMDGPNAVVDYNIAYDGSSAAESGLCWGPNEPPVVGDNTIDLGEGHHAAVISNLPPDGIQYFRAYVKSSDGVFYSSNTLSIYPGDTMGDGYLFESFEDIEIGEMPPAGWKKWEEAGGRGWSNSWAGRQPMPGWMSGTNSVPPAEGAGSKLAYVTYTHGGSKTNDLWLISPQIRNISTNYTLDFWYRSSFSNFADNIYVWVSTKSNAYRKSDFSIQAAHVSFPRGYPAPAGPGKWDFPEWTNIIVDIGGLVPEGSDVHVGFQEFHYNNWYDVRANEMDCIRMGTKSRSGLQFDGSDDLVCLPLTNAPTEYTIETWVKPLTSGARNLVVRSATNPLTAYSQQLRINASGQFEHYIYDGAEKTVIGTTVVQTGEWYHVAGSCKDSGTIRLIVNGTEEGTPLAVGTMLLTGMTNVFLGCATTHGDYPAFDGVLDEVRFWLPFG